MSRFSLINLFYMLQVVLADQAWNIYQAVKEKGVSVSLVECEGEQHGFRKVHDDLIIYLVKHMVFLGIFLTDMTGDFPNIYN